MVIAILFTCSLTFSAFATPIEAASKLDVINQYKTEDNIYTILDSKTLFSISSNQTYTLYELSPYGYAILLNRTNGLVEACYTEDAVIPVDMDSTVQYYYGGPGIYCIKQLDTFYNIFDQSYLSTDVRQSVAESEASVYSYEILKARTLSTGTGTATRSVSAASTTQLHAVGYDYFSNLVNYGSNNEDTCTVIAAIMLLSYYDNYHNDSIILSKYEDGNGTNESFHTLMKNYVYGSGEREGIYIREALQGINKYLTDSGLNMELKSEYSSQTAAINKAIDTLKSGDPVIASMGTTRGAPYDHSVLVYQVQYNSASPASTAVFTMNMGWKSGTVGGQSYTSYVASAGWFYECGYIQNTCTSHTLTSWHDYNSVYHCRHCTKCTYNVLEYHSDYWNALLGKCTRCGRTGIIAEIPELMTNYKGGNINEESNTVVPAACGDASGFLCRPCS